MNVRTSVHKSGVRKQSRDRETADRFDSSCGQVGGVAATVMCLEVEVGSSGAHDVLRKPRRQTEASSGAFCNRSEYFRGEVNMSDLVYRQLQSSASLWTVQRPGWLAVTNSAIDLCFGDNKGRDDDENETGTRQLGHGGGGLNKHLREAIQT
jgi:hypothetical protein